MLYGEEGVWWGKHQWGLRVDGKATEAAWKKEQKSTKRPAKAERGEVASFEKDIDESDLVDLEELTDLEAEQANLDLFGDASTATGNNYDEA